MRSRWRLLVDGPVDGALNMALDRSAQLAREAGIVPPTLRLYEWSRPTVSLGRFQSLDAVRPEVVRTGALDVVRRFTGGRGVLHDDEVTYAVVASMSDGIPRGVAHSYLYLCRALARAFRSLGVEAELTEHDRVASRSEACYMATTRADLSLGSRKLSGSAQVWSGSTVLQHGSLVLNRDVAREAAVFGLDDLQRERFRNDAATIAESAGITPARAEVIEALVEAFSEELDVELVSGSWTAEEARLAGDLVREVRIDV